MDREEEAGEEKGTVDTRGADREREREREVDREKRRVDDE